jgi:epoxyqueuosine reductase
MKSLIQQTAHDLGFAVCRITTAEPVSSELLTSWIDQGRHGHMRYMARNPERRCDPKSLLPGAKSVICCALAYGERGVIPTERAGRPPPSFGGHSGMTKELVARFARGADYHVVVREKLGELAEVIKARAPEAKTKCCVDTSPILEKVLAARAGVGWIGRHTLLVNPDLGSWFVLGEIIADIELEPDGPVGNMCDACTKCIDKCPTNALNDTSLDARKCLSYLTIECREEHGQSSYGCDVCQEVCPYNNTVNNS